MLLLCLDEEPIKLHQLRQILNIEFIACGFSLTLLSSAVLNSRHFRDLAGLGQERKPDTASVQGVSPLGTSQNMVSSCLDPGHRISLSLSSCHRLVVSPGTSVLDVPSGRGAGEITTMNLEMLYSYSCE
ncbi:hypothetical protein ElyMa_004564100 [Elysia marginata]|uniref:Uncharacterized protein n=1 Tax=Elysia marginata TaxID=1093978 RepID=A0AAV4HUA4_9GAST|nr:hypothetical protein ElyMa_004564100 [Elysia marginata]